MRPTMPSGIIRRRLMRASEAFIASVMLTRNCIGYRTMRLFCRLALAGAPFCPAAGRSVLVDGSTRHLRGRRGSWKFHNLASQYSALFDRQQDGLPLMRRKPGYRQRKQRPGSVQEIVVGPLKGG